MVTVSQTKWRLRAATLVLWALAAGSVAYWGLRLFAQRSVTITAPQAQAPVPVDPLAVARMLGATASQTTPAANAASRFALQGVVAGALNGGAALISIDGQPAKPFRIGSAVGDGLVLQSATARRATLAAAAGGPALMTLEMPPLKN